MAAQPAAGSGLDPVAIGGLFTLAGVLLTIAGTATVEWFKDRRQFRKDTRKERLDAYARFLGHLAEFRFEMIEVSRLADEDPEKELSGAEMAYWRKHEEAFYEHHHALHVEKQAAWLVASKAVRKALDDFDLGPTDKSDEPGAALRKETWLAWNKHLGTQLETLHKTVDSELRLGT